MDPNYSAPDLDIGGCSTELIQGAWQITTLLLARADLAGKQRLVRIRQAYLDELERRDPVGLRCWVQNALFNPDLPSPRSNSYSESDSD